MSSSQQSDITFGLELEFLATAPSSSYIHDSSRAARQYPGSAARAQVCHAITQNTDQPVATICPHDDEDPCAVCEAVAEGDSVCIGPSGRTWFTICSNSNARRVPGTNARTEYFVVKMEGLRADNHVQRAWKGLEITTPVFTTTDLNNGLAQVDDVTTAITNQGFPICINEDCGLHVHFGRTSGMTLLYAKKAITLVFLLEQKLIDKFCPQFRSESEHYHLVSVNSKVAQDQGLPQYMTKSNHWSQEFVDQYEGHVPEVSDTPNDCWGPHAPEQLDDILSMLWQAKSLNDLEGALTSSIGVKSGVNMSLRDENGPITPPRGQLGGMMLPSTMDPQRLEGSSSTLEFRYPPSTFDHDLVLHWTRIFYSIMRIALLDEDKYFRKLEEVLNSLEDTSGAWDLLLTNLDLHEDIAFWTEIRRRHDQEGFDMYHLHTGPQS